MSVKHYAVEEFSVIMGIKIENSSWCTYDYRVFIRFDSLLVFSGWKNVYILENSKILIPKS